MLSQSDAKTIGTALKIGFAAVAGCVVLAVGSCVGINQAYKKGIEQGLQQCQQPQTLPTPGK